MPFGSLWLPVIVSAVIVFVVSAVIHMALKYHRADTRKLPNEDAVAEVVRKGGPAPGVYFIPYCAEHAEMKSPATLKKFEDGPVALVTVIPNGPPKMGVHLTQWFAFTLFVSFVAAYVARHTLNPGSDGLLVMRITGTVAFAGYGFGCFQDSIWRGIPWPNSLRGILDSAIYAVATGLVFRLLWPGM